MQPRSSRCSPATRRRPDPSFDRLDPSGGRRTSLVGMTGWSDEDGAVSDVTKARDGGHREDLGPLTSPTTETVADNAALAGLRQLVWLGGCLLGKRRPAGGSGVDGGEGRRHGALLRLLDRLLPRRWRPSPSRSCPRGRVPSARGAPRRGARDLEPRAIAAADGQLAAVLRRVLPLPHAPGPRPHGASRLERRAPSDRRELPGSRARHERAVPPERPHVCGSQRSSSPAWPTSRCSPACTSSSATPPGPRRRPQSPRSCTR